MKIVLQTNETINNINQYKHEATLKGNNCEHVNQHLYEIVGKYEIEVGNWKTKERRLEVLSKTCPSEM